MDTLWCIYDKKEGHRKIMRVAKGNQREPNEIRITQKIKIQYNINER